MEGCATCYNVDCVLVAMYYPYVQHLVMLQMLPGGGSAPRLTNALDREGLVPNLKNYSHYARTPLAHKPTKLRNYISQSYLLLEVHVVRIHLIESSRERAM